MGFLDALFGRSRPPPPRLEELFRLPSAAVGLEASLGLKAGGRAGVCYKPAEAASFSRAEEEVRALLEAGAEVSGSRLEIVTDEFSYRWVVLEDPDLEDLVTLVHGVNRTLVEAGYGPQLLCSCFRFVGEAGLTYLVYLFKRGTYYPFCPREGRQRDVALEFRVRSALDKELPLERDPSQWFPLWGLPL